MYPCGLRLFENSLKTKSTYFWNRTTSIFTLCSVKYKIAQGMKRSLAKNTVGCIAISTPSPFRTGSVDFPPFFTSPGAPPARSTPRRPGDRPRRIPCRRGLPDVRLRRGSVEDMGRTRKGERTVGAGRWRCTWRRPGAGGGFKKRASRRCGDTGEKTLEGCSRILETISVFSRQKLM